MIRALQASRLRVPLTRSISTKYVTTPIFYPNAEPHVGHLYSMVFADVIKRYNALNDTKTYLLTGTDEHGLKIQTAAEKAGLKPKELCDQLAEKFKHLAEVGNIGNDRFMRTTDADHVATVNQMWKKLVDGGYIYKGSHSGYYCVSDETYYPEDKVHEVDGVLVSIETGKEVEWTEEENYFFNLEGMKDRLIEFYNQNPNFVYPKNVYESIKQEVHAGLPNLSISRPTSRLQWGIPVPNDDTHVIYVWLDALVNYATAQGFDAVSDAVHIVGKDIQRFHAIYWPAFLLAAEITPPKSVLVHTHWISDGQKMSKSIGNVVDPMHVIEKYGSDSVRFLLMCDGHLHKDNDFTEAKIAEKHNTLLVNKLSNLLMRITSARFDLPASLREPDQKVVDDMAEFFGPKTFTETRNDLIAVMKYAPRLYQANMATASTPKTIADIYHMINVANKLVEETKPWSFKEKEISAMLLREPAEAARIALILMQPFTPEFATKGLDRLGVKKERRTMQWTGLYADQEYGEGKNYKGDYPIVRIAVE